MDLQFSSLFHFFISSCSSMIISLSPYQKISLTLSFSLSLSHPHTHLVFHLSFVISRFHTLTSILFKDVVTYNTRNRRVTYEFLWQVINNNVTRLFFFKLTFLLNIFFSNIFLLPNETNKKKFSLNYKKKI